MRIFPAIDIRDSKVVRLTRGDYGQMKVYGGSPVATAAEFARQGAENLHVVDLDGAKDGTTANFGVIKEIVANCGLFVEVGGGIRDEARVEKYLSAGAGRVILGTAAVRNFGFVESCVKSFGDKIAVGVDASGGKVAVSGWLEVTDVDSLDFCARLRDAGVDAVIYTDISRDGAMGGTNLDVFRRLAEIKGLKIIASGGITFYDEIKALDEMGVYGAVLGKALYEGKINLAEALKI